MGVYMWMCRYVGVWWACGFVGMVQKCLQLQCMCAMCTVYCKFQLPFYLHAQKILLTSSPGGSSSHILPCRERPLQWRLGSVTPPGSIPKVYSEYYREGFSENVTEKLIETIQRT